MQLRFAVVLLAFALSAAACGSSNPAPAPTQNPPPAGGGGGSSGGGSTMSVSIVRGATALTTTAYSPNPVNVAVGTSITWTNNDTIIHTTTSNNNWDSGIMNPGATFTRTFSSAGTFQYICTVHPNMVGTVVVQ